jgi:hypothetical protein
MGVNPQLLQLSMTTASEDMRYLTVREMTDLGMITPVVEDEAVSDAPETDQQAEDTQMEAEEPQEPQQDALPRRRKVPPSTSTDG